jgi:DNA invertase Pin-like site-specific DNA recombinase
MRTKQPAPPTTDPVAFSYLRFSDPVQRKGDSVRRQTVAREAWLAAHPGVPLDMSLRLEDRGKSAFRRKDWDKYALAEFVRLIGTGRVRPGDYLLVENLDRLSREEAGDAVELFLSIVNRGVVVVQLLPQVLEFRRPVNTMSLMFAIVELSRGHSESEMKSSRSLANWEGAVDMAREGKTFTRKKTGRASRFITGRLPAWVIEKDGTPQLHPARGKVMLQLFEWALAGYGFTSIVKKLNAEHIPAFGDRIPDDDGYTKKNGDRYGCGEWRTSYVRDILSDRRAMGEFQPRDSNGKRKGDPIPGYYPAAVSPEVFHAAREAIQGRKGKQKPGRYGEGVANLFSGLLIDARGGRKEDTYYCAFRNDNGKKSRVLLNKTSIEGKAKCYTFPYATFERAVLSQLRELDPAEVLGREGPLDNEAVLRGELRHVRERMADYANELDRGGPVALLADKLRKLEAREAELTRALDEAAQQATLPLTASWRDAGDLIDLLDNAPDVEDVRLRLRSAIRRIVSEVRLLVVPRGRDRLALAQLAFEGGEQVRSYFLIHRSPKGNQSARTPGCWWAGALDALGGVWEGVVTNEQGVVTGTTTAEAWDLREPDDVVWAEHFLKTCRLLPADAKGWKPLP